MLYAAEGKKFKNYDEENEKAKQVDNETLQE